MSLLLLLFKHNMLPLLFLLVMTNGHLLYYQGELDHPGGARQHPPLLAHKSHLWTLQLLQRSNNARGGLFTLSSIARNANMLFCVIIVIVLPGPDWPWRCYLFNRPRHILSHVRLFLQNQVTSAVKLFATIG